MKLSKKNQAYLENKMRGGAINQKGNTYENYFTLFKIIEQSNKNAANPAAVIFSAQETTFVDDLLIIEVTKRYLYQLKTSKKLNWGRDVLKTLHFDFRLQRKIENFHKRQFELNLVTSEATLQKDLTSNLPSVLTNCTTIVLFPYFNTLSTQIQFDTIFKNELSILSAMANPTIDKLESLAACLLGFWEASSKKMIRLSDILNKVENLGYSFMKPRVIHKLSHRLEVILNAIPNFKYLEANGYLSWNYKNTDSGIFPHTIGSIEFNKIENDIVKYMPTNFADLEPLIS